MICKCLAAAAEVTLRPPEEPETALGTCIPIPTPREEGTPVTDGDFVSMARRTSSSEWALLV